MFNRTRYGYAVLDVTPDAFEVVFKDVLGAPLFGWRRTVDTPEGERFEP